MSLTRPLLALIVAFSMLFALPAAGANAGAGSGSASKKSAQKRAAAKKKKQRKRAKHKHAHKKKHPHKKGKAKAKRPLTPEDPFASDDDTLDPIGTVSAVDGDVVTVTLLEGGVLTGRTTTDSVVVCDGPDDADDSGDDGDDSADDVSGDDDDGDDPDARSLLLPDGTCQAAVGDAVYDAEVEDGVYDILDLSGF